MHKQLLPQRYKCVLKFVSKIAFVYKNRHGICWQSTNFLMAAFVQILGTGSAKQNHVNSSSGWDVCMFT